MEGGGWIRRFGGWVGDEVQTAVGEKKKAYREWKKNKTEEHGNKYRMAKKEATRVVAMAKARKYEDLYKRLETKEGERELYQVARQREKLKRDVEGVKCIKDEEGRVLVEDEDVRKRWKSYCCKLMNEGVEGGDDVEGIAGLEGEVGQVTVGEVVKVLMKMNNGEAVGICLLRKSI